MEVNAAMAGEDSTVHTMNAIHRVGPVFYASRPRDSATSRRDGATGEEAKLRLVATLWNHLMALESPLWEHCRSSNGAALPIQLRCGLLGRPQLRLGEYPGPAISFSASGGKIWAALCGDGADIGIDVAGTDEFPGAYPFHRVFQPRELEHALRFAGGELAAASALLWSIKEAVVKALGCAFHLVEPRQITVYPAAAGSAGEGGGYTFPVGLSGKARERFPLAASRSLWVRSLPLGQRWLSIAHRQRQPIVHE
jgi:hypothetical protein